MKSCGDSTTACVPKVVIAALVALAPSARLARGSAGARFALYAALYGMLRFALEPLRGDSVRGVVRGVSSSQLIGVIVALGAVAWLGRARRAST